MADSSNPVTLRDDGPAYEVEVSLDIVKRGLLVAPVIIAICGAIWGWHGAVSSGYAVALVLLNFAVSAGLIAWTSKISIGMLMGATLFGYLIRLGLIMLAVLAVGLWKLPRTTPGFVLGSAWLLGMFNLLNKQSFFNEWSLVVGLILVGLATMPDPLPAQPAEPAG